MDTASQSDSNQSQQNITANVDRNHVLRDMKFGFRQVKDEETGVESKRPTIEVKIPVLSVDGIIEVLKTGGKQLDLLMSAVEDVYVSNAKALLSDDQTITVDNFPFDKLTWDAIANQPESERRGRGIAKEVWEDFIKSYITIMPSATGKKEDQIKKQAAILAQKLNPLKNHEDKDKLLPKFKDMLAIYLNAAPEAEQFAECVKFLTDKADTYLNSDKNANLGENLGFE